MTKEKLIELWKTCIEYQIGTIRTENNDEYLSNDWENHYEIKVDTDYSLHIVTHFKDENNKIWLTYKGMKSEVYVLREKDDKFRLTYPLGKLQKQMVNSSLEDLEIIIKQETRNSKIKNVIR